MQKQSYKEQERQRRENEILRVAGEILAERGYANLNMDELAEVVGISKPTLYQHFKGKEELVCHVVSRSMEKLGQVTEDAGEGTPLQRITKIIRIMAKGRSRMNGLWGTMNAEIVWKASQDNPIFVEQRRKFGQRVEALIDDAKRVGEIRKDLPTPMLMRLIFCVQMAIVDPYLHPRASLSEEEADEAIENAVNFFLHGVTPPAHNANNARD